MVPLAHVPGGVEVHREGPAPQAGEGFRFGRRRERRRVGEMRFAGQLLRELVGVVGENFGRRGARGTALRRRR